MMRLFGSTYKSKLLSLFLSHPTETLSKTYIIYNTPCPLEAINTHLDYLEKIGLILNINSTYVINGQSKIFHLLNQLDTEITNQEND